MAKLANGSHSPFYPLGGRTRDGQNPSMCFSAIVEQDLARLMREFQAKLDLRAFKRLFKRRYQGDLFRIFDERERPFYEHKIAA